MTSVARTLLDLAGTTGRRRLARAVDEADRLELLDLEAVASLCDRSRGRRGPASLRRVLADHSPPALTRSELERRFLDVCASAALPTPATNVRVGGFEVDALWRERGLVVELDGYEYHRTRAAFERDRARDVALRLAGYAVVRFTYRQITNQPGVVTTALRALLTDETGPAGLFRSRIR